MKTISQIYKCRGISKAGMSIKKTSIRTSAFKGETGKGNIHDEKASCKNECKLSSCLHSKDFSTSRSLYTRSILYSSSLLIHLSSNKVSEIAARQRV